MKNFKYQYVLYGLFSLILFSCEDFLDQSPRYNVTTDNAVTDYSSAKNVINGIYSRLTLANLGGEINGRLSSQAGVWKYYDANYNQSYRQGTNDGASIWLQLYQVVNAANAAVELVSKVDESKFPSKEEKERLIAEARGLRGFVYLQIHWLWSHWWDTADNPYGLLYREEIADLSNLQKGRISVGESYDFIIQDFEYAEENLGDFTSSRYISKQFIQALHAKLLLNRGWEGDYAEAIALVEDVKNNAPVSFQLETDLSKMYEDSWDSREVLFARYLGDLSNITYNEFIYSYALYYDNELNGLPADWVNEDPRYSIITGVARAPETWDERTSTVFTKLYREGRVNGPNDKYATYYFRYAELYLMEAELKARLNPSDISGALEPINELRSKYINPVLPLLTASNQQELFDVIFKEIIVTLFLENGSEWFASIRFQKDGRPWLHTLKPDVVISPEKYCWPIPDTEIKAHTNTIEQNPTLE